MKQIYLLFASLGFVFFLLGFPELAFDKSDSTTYSKKIVAEAKQKANPPKKYRPLVLKNIESEKQTINFLAPSITATKSVTVQGGGNPVPGSQLNYSVVVANGGPDAATAVTFTDILVSDLTLVGGSVKATPIAGDDAYTSIGNVGINVPSGNGLLINDNSPTNETITVTAVNTAGTSGTVTFNPNGSFTFSPNPGFSGNTTFSYTATGSTSSLTGTGTVTITVTSPVWFVDIAATTSTNVGTLANPFKDWSDFAASNALSGATNPAANQTIFVYSGTYTGAATLKSGQKVLGAGATASLAFFASITLPAHSSPALPGTNSTKPNLTSAGTTITLGANNTLRGFDMGNSVKDIVGSSFNTLTASEMALNGDGQALDLTSGSLTCTFTSISSNDSADKGISFSGINGTLTSTGGTTITNPAAQGILVFLSSSVNANYGNTSVTGSGGTGVQLSSGAIPTTTFGSLTITPDAGQQALVSNSNNGTITCTSGNITNRINLQGASASLKLTLNIELTSYTSDGNLQLSNTTGSFRINGTGTSGSGGSMSGITTGPSILLNNVSNVSINYFNITNAGKSCYSATNLSGTCVINNCSFSMGTGSSSAVGNDRRCVSVENKDVALTFNVDGSTFTGNLTASPDNNHGIAYETTTDASNTTIGTLNIKTSAFNRFNNYAVYTTSTGAAITDVGVQGSTVNYDGGTSFVGGAFHLWNLRSAKTTFNILNNTSLSTKGGLPVDIFSNNFDSSTDFTPASGRGMEGKFNGNILNRHSTDAGTSVNILVKGKSNGVVQVNGNTITKGNLTIQASENTPSAATETARLDATITNNTVEELLSNYGIDVLSGNGNTPVDINGNGTFSNVINCVKISGNTISPIDGSGLGLLRFRTEGTTGGNASRIWREGVNGTGEASSTTYWNGNSNLPNSPGSSPTSTRVRDSGFGILEFKAGGTCLTPSNNAPARIAAPDYVKQEATQSEPEDVLVENAIKEDIIIEKSEKQVVTKSDNLSLTTFENSIASPNSGETVTVNGAGSGFTLPANKSTTITFSATVATIPSTCAIANQATVTFTGGGSPVSSNNLITNLIVPPPTGVTTATAICNGQSVSLSATCSSGAIQWYNAAATATLIGTGSPLVQSPTSSTTYQAGCLVGGCESARINTGLITVNPLPVPAPASNSPVCSGNSLNLSSASSTSYYWAGPNSFTSTVRNPSISNVSIVAGGTYTITQTTSLGCTASATVAVVINAVPVASAGSNTPICAGQTLNLTSTGDGTYLWAGPNTFTSTSQNPNITSATTAATGNYTVTVTNASGCTSTAAISVVVNATPVITASNNSPVCAGNPLNLSSTSGGTTYNWSGPNSFTSSIQNPVITSTTASNQGIYNVTISNSFGCTSTATTSATVTVIPPPTSPSSDPASRTTVGTVTLTSVGCSGTVTWYDVSNSTVALPNNTPNLSTTTTFFARCTQGGCTSEPSTNVIVSVVLCTPLGASPGDVPITWTGIEDTDWNKPCNWSPAWAPDLTTGKAIIPNTTNKPIIAGTVPDVTVIEIQTSALLTISSTGTLNVRGDGGVNKGIWLNKGNLTNNGNINIQSAGNTAIDAYIYLSTDFSNGATFTNNGIVTINSTDEAIGVGISANRPAIVNNNANGIINVTNGIGVEVVAPSDILQFNNVGTFNYNGAVLALKFLGTTTLANSGTINVNSGTGIENPVGSQIANSQCAKIIMAAGTYTNGGTTTNAGLIQMPNAYDFVNTGTFTNTGVLKANTVSSITNNKMVITNACPIFTLGGTNNYTVSGIFTDAGALTSAGTYNSGTNKFTANNIIPTGTQTLYAQVTDGTCTFVVPFDFNNVLPTAVSVNNTTVCAGTSVTLSATCASGTITWYDAATGTSIALGTGTGLTTIPVVNPTTYYASCETANCVSGRVATSEVTVNPTPAEPTGVASSNSTICSGTTIMLSATCATGTLNWYTTITGGVSIGTSSPLSVTPLVNTTYFPSCELNGCASPRSSSPMVSGVLDNTKPTFNRPASNGTLSNAGTAVHYNVHPINFSTTGSKTISLDAPDGAVTTPSTFDSFLLLYGSGGFNPASPLTNLVALHDDIASATNRKSRIIYNVTTTGAYTIVMTSFYNVPDGTNGDNPLPWTYTLAITGAGGSLPITVNPTPNAPTGVSVNQTEVCDGTQIVLTATCGNVPVAPLFSGLSPQAMSEKQLTASPQAVSAIDLLWYNSATGGVAIGTGSPFNHTQVIGTTTYYAACKEGDCESSRVATSAVTVNAIPATPTVTLTTASVVCEPSTLNLTASGCAGMVTWSDNSTGTSLTISAVGTYSITAICTVNGCPSPASSAVSGLEIKAKPAAPTIVLTSASSVCTPATLNLTASACAGTITWSNAATGTSLTLSAVGTYSITATCSVNGCTSDASNVVGSLEIKQTPAAPTITLTTASVVCEPSTLNLTASGCAGTVTWSNAATGTSLTISAVGTYSITATCTVNGCPSGASNVVNGLEIKALPNAQASNTGPYSFGQTINLSASGGSIYSWSGPNSFSSTMANPSIFNAQLPLGGIYSVTVTNVGCSATATTEVIVSGIDPCVQILAYDYVLAGNPSQTLFSMTNGQNIAQRPTATSIIVRPICNSVTIGSVDMTITGPSLNWTILQNVEPFALFDNSGSNIYGQVLAPGTYSLTVTGYFGDNRTGGTTYGPVVTTFTIVGNAPTISMPTFAGTEFCAGTNVNVSFTTTGTFAGGNLFQVLLSDANGNFNSPQIIGTTTAAGSVLCNIPPLTIGGDNYRIKVVSTDPAASGNYSPVALTVNPLIYNLVSPTNDYPVGTATKKAIETINARNNITGASRINYKAGNAINLNPGFQVVSHPGSSFKAQIEGCSN